MMVLPKTRRGGVVAQIGALATLAMVLQGSPARGQVVQRLGPAAVELSENRAHSFGGRVVRCQLGQQVGIRANSRAGLAITDVVVEGCEVGILLTGPLVQLQRATVRSSRARGCTAGILDMGAGTTATFNITSGCKYGIVIMGDDNTYASNQSTDNTEDGILVTGHRNLLEGNQALRNGAVGIHAASTVPMVARSKFLSFIQDRAFGNVIRENTALNNRLDVREFGECEPPPFPPLPNDWIDNVFNTRSPDCIE